MTPTDAEQLLLELINRARLDPAAEAARQGIDLNQGLEPGSIDTTSKQPLALSTILNTSAKQHSIWMLENDTFSHTGDRDTSSHTRMEEAGYTFVFPGGSAENLSYIGTTGTIDANALIDDQHDNLYESTSHRPAIFRDLYREVGLGQEVGTFYNASRDIDFNAVMLTENFARSGETVFLTGVVYDDTDEDAFYDIGEGRGSVDVGDTQTWDTGGYSLGFADYGTVAATLGGIELSLDLSAQNAKVDVVDGTRIFTSTSTEVVDGSVTELRALGLNAVALTGGEGSEQFLGTVEGDTLMGNGGNDLIYGNAGADRIEGGANYDTIHSGEGNDQVWGDNGRDLIFLNQGNDLFSDNAQGGELGQDTVFAGFGDDTIEGGNGNDVFHGEWGNDLINARLGDDMVYGGDGFDVISAGDGNDQVWGGNGRDTVFLNQGNDLFSDNGQGGELGQDTVYGGFGNDTIEGGNGNDLFLGEWGDDLIFARKGDDTLEGGDGNDTLDGGLDADVLTGGEGNDVFRFAGDVGDDRITDFNVAQDMLEFSGNASALSVSASLDGVVLSWGSGQVLLEGLASDQFDLNDVVLI